MSGDRGRMLESEECELEGIIGRGSTWEKQ